MPRVDPIMQAKPGQVIFNSRGRVIGYVFLCPEFPWDELELRRRRKGK